MSARSISILVLLVLFSSVAFAQQIFKWKDKKGQWHFSDAPPPGVTGEKVRGLDISPKSSPAISPYDKFSESSLAESENKEQAIKPPAKRPPDVLPGKLTNRWVLVRAQQGQLAIDESKPLSELRYWEAFDSAEACEIERTIEIEKAARQGSAIMGQPIIAGSDNSRRLRCVSSIELKPSKEANVILVSYLVEPAQRGQGRPTLIGRLFNRGLATARNVAVKYKALNDRGFTVGKGEISTTPQDIPGLTAAEFRGEIRGGAGVNRLRVDTEVDWSRE